MTTYVIHFKDGTSDKVEAGNLGEALLPYDRRVVSYYESLESEQKAKVNLAAGERPVRRFKVPSAHTKEKYDVIVGPGSYIDCNCIAGGSFHRSCWHKDTVRDFLAGTLSGEVNDMVASWEVKE